MLPNPCATQALVLFLLGASGIDAAPPAETRTGGLIKATLTRDQLQEVGRLAAETVAKEDKGDFYGGASCLAATT